MSNTAIRFLDFDKKETLSRSELGTKLGFYLHRNKDGKKEKVSLTFSKYTSDYLRQRGLKRLSIAVNDLEKKMYFLFTEDEGIELKGYDTDKYNLSIGRKDVFNAVCEYLNFDAGEFRANVLLKNLGNETNFLIEREEKQL